jgi:hypothetical protein
LALVFSFPISANAAGWENGFCFRAVDGYAEIIKVDQTLSGDIVIPDYYGGYGVEYVGVEAFKDCTEITSITFGENIGGIYYNAFKGCTKLTTVNFGAKSFSEKYSAGSPERPVFADCPNLTTVNVGAGVESIPKYLFYGVSSLTTVNFEGAVPKIGENAFYGCAVDLGLDNKPASSSSSKKPTSSIVKPSSSRKPVSSQAPDSDFLGSEEEINNEPSSSETVVPSPSSDTPKPEGGGINLGLVWGIAGGALAVLAAVFLVLLKGDKKNKDKK